MDKNCFPLITRKYDISRELLAHFSWFKLNESVDITLAYNTGVQVELFSQRK